MNAQEASTAYKRYAAVLPMTFGAFAQYLAAYWTAILAATRQDKKLWATGDAATQAVEPENSGGCKGILGMYVRQIVVEERRDRDYNRMGYDAARCLFWASRSELFRRLVVPTLKDSEKRSADHIKATSVLMQHFYHPHSFYRSTTKFSNSEVLRDWMTGALRPAQLGLSGEEGAFLGSVNVDAAAPVAFNGFIVQGYAEGRIWIGLCRDPRTLRYLRAAAVELRATPARRHQFSPAERVAWLRDGTPPVSIPAGDEGTPEFSLGEDDAEVRKVSVVKKSIPRGKTVGAFPLLSLGNELAVGLVSNHAYVNPHGDLKSLTAEFRDKVRALLLAELGPEAFERRWQDVFANRHSVAELRRIVDGPRNLIAYASPKINEGTRLMLDRLRREYGWRVRFAFKGQVSRVSRPVLRDATWRGAVVWDTEQYAADDAQTFDHGVLVRAAPRVGDERLWWVVAGVSRGASVGGQRFLFDAEWRKVLLADLRSRGLTWDSSFCALFRVELKDRDTSDPLNPRVIDVKRG